MKAVPTIASIVLFGAFATVSFAQGTYQYFYVRSNVALPWGQSTNEDAMDNTFGPNNWTTAYYETLDITVLLASTTKFVFLEGGDSSFNGDGNPCTTIGSGGFQCFMQLNGPRLYQWISNGGRLLIMSAPNDPLASVQLYLPDNVVLWADAFYGSAASGAYAIDDSNSIFDYPNSATTRLSGNFVSHGYFTGGSSVSKLMQSNLDEVILAQDRIGSGIMVYGGMTTDNFHSPQPDAHALLENILFYTANTNLH